MSLSFNGTSSKLSWAGNIKASYPVSIFGWIKPAASMLTANQVIFGTGRVGAGKTLCAYTAITPGKVHAFTRDGGGSVNATSAESLVAGAWTPVLLVFESASSRRAYVGVGSTGGTPETSANNADMPVHDIFTIGTFTNSDSSWAEMTAAHVAVWGSALTGAEFTALAAGSAPSAVAAGSLIEYWPLSTQATTQTGVNGRVLSASNTTQGAGDPLTTSGITVIDLVERRVVQRSGTSAQVAVSGTYSGAPTSIQARVVLHDTMTGVVPWTTIVPTPTGGVFSGSLTVPQGGWYNIQVRHGDDTATVANGTARWGVGLVVALSGQSNAERWQITGSGTPADLTSTFNGAWGVNIGAGAIAFANTLSAGLALPVAIVQGATSGAALNAAAVTSYGYWLNTSGVPYTNWQARVTGAGGKVEAIIWIQGENDAAFSISAAQYQADLATIIARMRAHLAQPTAPVFVAPLIRTTGYYASSDANWQEINSAILSAADVVVACDVWDLPLDDGVHYSAAGYAVLGQRFALAVRKYLGASVSSRGPYISTAVKISSTVIDLSLIHSGGSDFTPTSAISGLRFVDGTGVRAPSSVVRQASNKVRATFATAISGAVTVWCAYGQNPSVTGPLVDTLALPLRRTLTAGIAVAEVSTDKKISLTLTLDGAAPAASMTGLKWAFFDQTDVSALTVPSVLGTASTDADGLLDLTVTASALAVGAVGWLIVTNSDGTTTQSPAAKAFSGPVVVS